MSDFICKKCGSTEYEIKDKPNGTGIAHGLYCAKCGFWHKWLGKEELKQYATKESKDEIIAKLQSENAALRERLDKAVLNHNVYYIASIWNDATLTRMKEVNCKTVDYVCDKFVECGGLILNWDEIYFTRDAALARLAELKGEER